MSESEIRSDLVRLPADRHFSWIDDGVLPYALAGLRALWIWLLLHLLYTSLLPGQGDMLGGGTVFGLLAGGTLTSQVFVFRAGEGRAAERRAALYGALIGLAAVLLALYAGPGRAVAPLLNPTWLAVIGQQPGVTVVTVLPAAGLWLWGILTGRERVYHETLLRSFAVGLVALLAAMIFSYAARLLPTGLVVGVLAGFVALGLVSLAIASLQETRRFEGARAEQSLPMARYWWGTVGSTVALLLLLGLLLAQLLAPGTLEAIADLLAAALRAVGWLLSWIILIIAYPILKLFEWLARFIHLPESEGEPFEMRVPEDLTRQFEELAQDNATGPGSQFPWWVVIALVAALVIVVVFVLAFRRFRAFAEEGEIEETRESILSLDLLKAQLAEWLRRRGARTEAQPPPYALLIGESPQVRVRRTYQALLVWANGRGLARPPGLTPGDYAQVLSNAYPAYRSQFGAITSAYDQARYSPLPLPAEWADRAEVAWQQVAAESSAGA